MKNLILPFVVVALFAVGSCGDEASINPPVDKKDRTIIKDTTNSNDSNIVNPFNIINYDSIKTNIQYYAHHLSNGYPNGISDTVLPANFPNMHGYGKAFGMNPVIKQDSSISISYYSHDPGLFREQVLSFKIDYSARKVYNLKFSQTYTMSWGDNSQMKQSTSQYAAMEISSAPYLIEGKNMIINLTGNQLIENLKIKGVSYSTRLGDGYRNSTFVSIIPSQGESWLKIFLSIN